MTGVSGIIVCEACAEPVDLNNPTLIRAGVKRGPSASPTADEPEILFHAECFPTGSPVWERR